MGSSAFQVIIVVSALAVSTRMSLRKSESGNAMHLADSGFTVANPMKQPGLGHGTVNLDGHPPTWSGANPSFLTRRLGVDTGIDLGSVAQPTSSEAIAATTNQGRFMAVALLDALRPRPQDRPDLRRGMGEAA
jgi:hypothetical protein